MKPRLARLLTLGALLAACGAYALNLLPLALLLLSLLGPPTASAANVRPAPASVVRMPPQTRPSPQAHRSRPLSTRHLQFTRNARSQHVTSH